MLAVLCIPFRMCAIILKAPNKAYEYKNKWPKNFVK